jgi:hypothetical protein
VNVGAVCSGDVHSGLERDLSAMTVFPWNDAFFEIKNPLGTNANPSSGFLVKTLFSASVYPNC